MEINRTKCFNCRSPSDLIRLIFHYLSVSTLLALEYVSHFNFLTVCYGNYFFSAVVLDDRHFLLYYKEHYFMIVFLLFCRR